MVKVIMNCDRCGVETSKVCDAVMPAKQAERYIQDHYLYDGKYLC